MLQSKRVGGKEFLEHRSWEHYCYTGEWVYKCNCTVFNLPLEEVVKLTKRANCFKKVRLRALDAKTTIQF